MYKHPYRQESSILSEMESIGSRMQDLGKTKKRGIGLLLETSLFIFMSKTLFSMLQGEYKIWVSPVSLKNTGSNSFKQFSITDAGLI